MLGQRVNFRLSSSSDAGTLWGYELSVPFGQPPPSGGASGTDLFPLARLTSVPAYSGHRLKEGTICFPSFTDPVDVDIDGGERDIDLEAHSGPGIRLFYNRRYNYDSVLQIMHVTVALPCLLS
jgi:hypothetical protein